jgi:uncharacterized Fe-S radical SAM superfamily protein PflX
MDRNTYTFVGVSRHPNGELAVRYTNDKNRARVLAKNGHTEILFLELDMPERVEDCMSALMDYVEDNEAVDLLDVVRNEANRVGFAV